MQHACPEMRVPSYSLRGRKWGLCNDDEMRVAAVLATTGTEDVRPVLHYYQGKDVVATFKANQAVLRAAEVQAEAARMEAEKPKGVWSWLSIGKH